MAKYIFLSMLSLLLASCEKSLFPHPHANEKVNVMIEHIPTGSGNGANIDTDIGQSSRIITSRFKNVSIKGTYKIENITSTGYQFSYDLKSSNSLLIKDLHGKETIRYGEYKIIKLNGDFTLFVQPKK